MKRALSFLILAFCASTLFAQTHKPTANWELFKEDVKIKYLYSKEHQVFLPSPKFGDKVRALDGKTIFVNGFFLPVDVTGSAFVISYNPMENCFFCTGNGIETIIEINPSEKAIKAFKKLTTDSYIYVKGKLTLNDDNWEHLIYILDDVELVKKVK